MELLLHLLPVLLLLGQLQTVLEGHGLHSSSSRRVCQPCGPGRALQVGWRSLQT